ncbi:hypothetical protein [Candidatus Manganitrophus noduliformans]|uniref:hypothetical protein n=1 Tax=Candidatus Manganitrophus noduliformans TaxID=2606439 RepID=UPI00143B4AFE|nr:hypothetical protein [Candidatus Manganitrophus noduliformans]
MPLKTELELSSDVKGNRGYTLTFPRKRWADPVDGLIIVFFAAKEGYEALKEEKLCCD